jgi:hypothetical protein
MLVEIKNLINKETFSLNDWPRLNEQVLPTKLVYKAKQTSKGNLEKLKSRVIAHGDLEKGPYKMDTWAPCATARGIKILLAFAAKHNKSVKSRDFVGAYLQAKQVGRVFVSLDKSFAEYFLKYKSYFGRPLLLKKGIYGLTISGKLWSIEFTQWLMSQDFKQSNADTSFFIFHDRHGGWICLTTLTT